MPILQLMGAQITSNFIVSTALCKNQSAFNLSAGGGTNDQRNVPIIYSKNSCENQRPLSYTAQITTCATVQDLMSTVSAAS